MRHIDVFSVQRVSSDGIVALGNCVSVEALCAVKAGEAVLSEPLSLHGQVVRAKVCMLKDDYTPYAVSLYAPQSAQ